MTRYLAITLLLCSSGLNNLITGPDRNALSTTQNVSAITIVKLHTLDSVGDDAPNTLCRR